MFEMSAPGQSRTTITGWEPFLTCLNHMHNIVAHCIEHEIAHRVQVKLSHDVRAVGLGCPHTEAQGDGYFFCALSFNQQLHDLALTRSQTVPPDQRGS